VGALNPKTMRLFGMLRTHKVAVLLDTGSNIFGLRNVAEGSLASWFKSSAAGLCG